ncbi:DUF6036 family nucleotidyltransferase [Rhabdothermincola salaria]|uniref:DUF6036 family nucleotidyltransferase n=1 Tax=Rhabdothermincola salaria TaxID=2903142 RepID=UPI001E31CF76|nr:DUF6036 family nucleotidyltransferase [Rhabdothermincola salaria]MCD9622833.1 DUF6036 family nucleotidyltransferase [Rhabdothermincola salaria]
MAVTLGRDDIISALDELVDALAESGARSQIHLIGGAAITIAYSRAVTTTDVDAFYGGDVAVCEAVKDIAARRGWPENWLNDRANQFRSHFEQPDDWMELTVNDGVVVRVASARLLLAMKLLAARGRRDSDDIDVLLDACGITSLDEALEIYERYYPEEDLKPRARRQLERRLG